MKRNDPCIICESYMKGVRCDNDKCPVAIMKKENKKLKEKIGDLEYRMSYMDNPLSIGDRHEMGSW